MVAIRCCIAAVACRLVTAEDATLSTARRVDLSRWRGDSPGARAVVLETVPAMRLAVMLGVGILLGWLFFPYLYATVIWLVCCIVYLEQPNRLWR